MKKDLKPMIITPILSVLPIGAFYFESLNNMYMAVTVGMAILFIYVAYQSSHNRLNKEAPLSKAIILTFIWNTVFCILVGWWWLMSAWLYVAMIYFSVRGQKNKNDVKGE